MRSNFHDDIGVQGPKVGVFYSFVFSDVFNGFGQLVLVTQLFFLLRDFFNEKMYARVAFSYIFNFPVFGDCGRVIYAQNSILVNLILVTFLAFWS